MKELRHSQTHFDYPGHLYMGIDHNGRDAYNALREAWRRPVRHNHRIERRALWWMLNIDQEYDAVIHSDSPSRYFRSPYVDTEACYEFESAFRMIPELLPLTAEERRLLWRNTEDVYARDYRIGAIGQLALVERWHDWLWDSQPGRRDEPSREGQMLDLACRHLVRANLPILNAEQKAWAIEGQSLSLR